METFQNFSIVILSFMILFETVIRIKNGLTNSERKDWFVCMMVGLTSLSVSLTTKGFFLNYFREEQSIRDVTIPFMMTIVLFILNDFGSYWYHRLAHSSRLFWATHIVHHSSHNFNLTVGIRESIIEGVYRLGYWSFYCMIGFPATAVFMVDGVSLIFQAFIHTRLVGKLGILEHIINTPSSHRVHHSSNPEYIDKNFGAVLIIWDKIFGTYCSEVSVPKYGVVGQQPSYNFFTINFTQWKVIVLNLKKSKTISDVIHSLFGSPRLH